MSQEALGKSVGLSQSAVAKLENGGTDNPRKLKEIAAILDVTEEELRFGKSITDDDSINMNISASRQAVPLFEMKDNALHSAVATFDALALLKIMYPAQALAPSVDLLGIICNSDAMKPTINNGEVMLCDRSVRQFAGDGIYIIRNNVLFVRRLSLGTDNTVSAYAENRQYDTITQPLSAIDVVARVIGVFLYTPMG